MLGENDMQKNLDEMKKVMDKLPARGELDEAMHCNVHTDKNAQKVEVIWLSLFLLSSWSLEICWMESEGCFLYCRLASSTIRTRWLPASETDVDGTIICT